MATNTWVALDKQTVTGSAVGTIEFTGIPATYTDLIMTITSVSSGLDDIAMQLGNGSYDTASNYSTTFLYNDSGSGSGVSGRTSNATTMTIADSGTAWSTSTLQFQSYTNTSINKSVLCQTGSGSWATFIKAGLWRNTNAIERIKLTHSGNFLDGSTFSLYGIRAEGVSPAPKATGGAIYSDSTYYYHVFGSTGVFAPSTSISADILVVAGGGGGGGSYAGGGGAGGLLTFTSQSLTATNYTCTVGAGGNGGAQNNTGSTGGDSQFGALTLVKGGGAGGNGGSVTANTGGNGGSGGGAGRNAFAGGTVAGGTATSGQGNNGGSYLSANAGNLGAGGGGAGAVGGSQNVVALATAGYGGVGSSTYSSWGTATGVGQFVAGTYYLAGGGGGGAFSGETASGLGGYGGGANGGYGVSGSNGTVNTGGGGGGGGGNTSYAGGSGGSGVVIVRYAK
jgi:hypothetical protein